MRERAVSDFAQRLARLRENDPAAMVEEMYSPGIVVQHAGRGERGRIVGRQALYEAEQELKETIPDHRNEIIRVIQGTNGLAVVESLIVGTERGDDELQCCPACLWWRFDKEGRVAEELAFFEWGKRQAYSAQARGTIIKVGGRARPSGWYREMGARLAGLWSTDPARMVSELYAEDTVVERLGEGPEAVLQGSESLLQAELDLLEQLPVEQRRMDLVDVAYDRELLAVHFTISGSWGGNAPVRTGPGCVVLTLNKEDRIVSDRIYWHWSRSREHHD